MSVGRRVKLGLVAVAAVVGALLLAASPASASAGRTVHGYGSDTNFGFVGEFATRCGNEFTGVVTADDGHGGIVASIDNVRINCQGDVRITANAPWTLKLQEERSVTIEGFDVYLTTSQGTCRYVGTVAGGLQFPNGLYYFQGSLTRQSAGCGKGAQLFVSETIEVISVSA